MRAYRPGTRERDLDRCREDELRRSFGARMELVRNDPYAPDVLTLFGVASLTFMMSMYALEARHRKFVLAFALGCALSSAYGFLSGAWPFGVVEAFWTVIAGRRFMRQTRRPAADD